MAQSYELAESIVPRDERQSKTQCPEPASGHGHPLEQLLVPVQDDIDLTRRGFFGGRRKRGDGSHQTGLSRPGLKRFAVEGRRAEVEEEGASNATKNPDRCGHRLDQRKPELDVGEEGVVAVANSRRAKQTASPFLFRSTTSSY